MAWWKTAKVGDKVVCVDDNWKEPNMGSINPVKGSVYIIDEILPFALAIGGVILSLEGFSRNYYCAAYFRPVVNRSSETGVAALKRHLVGAPVTEGAQ